MAQRAGKEDSPEQVIDTSLKEQEDASCLACRVTGTVVCLGSSAYLTTLLYGSSPPRGLHRGMTIAFAAGFAAMGVVRAFI